MTSEERSVSQSEVWLKVAARSVSLDRQGLVPQRHQRWSCGLRLNIQDLLYLYD